MTEEISAQENNLDALLNKHFAGKVVRRDLTKLLKGKGRTSRSMSWSTCSGCTARPMTRQRSSPA